MVPSPHGSKPCSVLGWFEVDRAGCSSPTTRSRWARGTASLSATRRATPSPTHSRTRSWSTASPDGTSAAAIGAARTAGATAIGTAGSVDAASIAGGIGSVGLS